MQIIELLFLVVCIAVLLSAARLSLKKKTPEFLIQEAKKIKEQLEAHRVSLQAKKESLSMKKQSVDIMQEEIRTTEELKKVSKELRDIEKELGCIDPDTSESLRPKKE